MPGQKRLTVLFPYINWQDWVEDSTFKMPSDTKAGSTGILAGIQFCKNDSGCLYNELNYNQAINIHTSRNGYDP